MIKGNKKIFLDKEKLYTMVNLRQAGFATTSLSIMFNVNRSSIENQCDKYLIKPLDQTFTIERILSDVLPMPKESVWMVIDGRKVNQGKNYQDYVNDRKKREIYAHRIVSGINL